MGNGLSFKMGWAAGDAGWCPETLQNALGVGGIRRAQGLENEQGTTSLVIRIAILARFWLNSGKVGKPISQNGVLTLGIVAARLNTKRLRQAIREQD
jgi:hypothetical protein